MATCSLPVTTRRWWKRVIPARANSSIRFTACRQKRGRLPSRADIYSGALGERYIVGYSNSLMDNFIMDVQGSGYVDYGDGRPLTFFGYGGKNGHAYRSIGKELIDRGEVKREDMSMQAIRHWGETHAARKRCANCWSRTHPLCSSSPKRLRQYVGQVRCRWWQKPR